MVKSILASRRLNPKSCLDLACGNGVASVMLAKQGMKVIGLDISNDMLKLSRRRAKGSHVKVDFLQGDMRSFRLPERVDMAVSLYDSLNYLLKLSDLAKCFKCVFDSLSDNGIFIFDMNTRKILENWNRWRNFSEKWNTGLVGEFDPKRNLAKLKAIMFVKRKDDDDDSYQRFVEVHTEKAYANREIAGALRKAGFSKVKLSEFSKGTGRLLGVASK